MEVLSCMILLTDSCSHVQTYNSEQKSAVTPPCQVSMLAFSLGGISVAVFILDIDLFGE